MQFLGQTPDVYIIISKIFTIGKWNEPKTKQISLKIQITSYINFELDTKIFGNVI